MLKEMIPVTPLGPLNDPPGSVCFGKRCRQEALKVRHPQIILAAVCARDSPSTLRYGRSTKIEHNSSESRTRC